MTSKEAMKKACKDVGVDNVAKCLKLSKTALYNQMNDQDRNDILYKFVDFNNACENDISIKWACEELDGLFVKNPEIEANQQQISSQCVPKSMQEFTDVVREISKAFEDGKVSQEEAEIIRKEWEDLKAVLESAILSWEYSS